MTQDAETVQADILDQPAVDPQNVGAFDFPADLPDADDSAEAGAPAPSTSEVRSLISGVLKHADRVLSILLRCDKTSDDELTEFVNMISPAASQHREKLGSRFWSLVGALGVLGFLINKVLTARAGRVPVPNGDAQPSTNGGSRRAAPGEANPSGSSSGRFG